MTKMLPNFIRFSIYTLVLLCSLKEESPILLLFFVILSNISIIFKTYRSLPLLLMFLFFLTYVVNLIPFFFNGDYIFYYPTTKGFYETLFIHALFLFSLDTFLFPIKSRFFINEKLSYKKNYVVFIILLVFFLLFLVFSIQGDTVLDTGGYGREGKVKSLGGFGEYFLILIPLLYIYSGGIAFLNRIVMILLLLMGIKLLLYGGRIGILMMGILYFILYWDTRKNKLSPFKLFSLSLPIIYILVLIGSIRGNIALALNSSLGELFLLPFRGDFLSTYIEFFGNQNDIFYSSTILNQSALAGTISITTRLEMFFYNVLSIFVPYSFLPPEAAIIPYIQENISPTGGGGLISAFAYFFLSYIGVILIGLYIATLINTLQKTKNMILILYVIMVFSTYPRWFGYNIIALFKISFYIIPMYLLIELLIKSICKK